MDLVYRHNQIGNPPALPVDSRSLIIPAIVVRLELGFASFPLTPTLSPRRGGDIRPCFGNTTELGCRVPPKRRTQRRGLQLQHSNFPARSQCPPSPGGEGWGEGEQGSRSLGRFRIGFGTGKSPERPHGFEPFIVSSLALCRRQPTVPVYSY